MQYKGIYLEVVNINKDEEEKSSPQYKIGKTKMVTNVIYLKIFNRVFFFLKKLNS